MSKTLGIPKMKLNFQNMFWEFRSFGHQSIFKSYYMLLITSFLNWSSYKVHYVLGLNFCCNYSLLRSVGSTINLGGHSDVKYHTWIFYIHCKYLNARSECNDIVISVNSHYPLDSNAKSFVTKGVTLSFRWFCIRIERVMTVYRNYDVIAFNLAFRYLQCSRYWKKSPIPFYTVHN